MRRTLVPALALALLACAGARPAAAQMGGINLGAAVGVSAPSGDISGLFNSGYHIQGLADLSLPLVPIGFRGELAYDQLGAKGSSPGPLKVASGVFDATFSVPFPVLHPYAIGGLGYYLHNGGAGIGSREGKVGFNGGVGVELKLPVIRVFGEARYHSISYPGTRVAMIPLTVGIVF
ncbi:MAG TPA: outer membrane beta-barrel protein [Longimicrobiales bacterium]